VSRSRGQLQQVLLNLINPIAPLRDVAHRLDGIDDQLVVPVQLDPISLDTRQASANCVRTETLLFAASVR